MKCYEIITTEVATGLYHVYANSPTDAVARLEEGEFDSFRDLGHDDMQIIDVKEV